MIYIGTKEQVEAYLQKVNNLQGYTGSVTTSYDKVMHHPTREGLCAIYAHATEPDEESLLKLVEELTEDWNPTEEE